jgi:hypothetical protein
MKYPRINRKELTPKQKKTFNYWRKVIKREVDMLNPELGLGREKVETIAWNVAFMFLTDEGN